MAIRTPSAPASSRIGGQKRLNGPLVEDLAKVLGEVRRVATLAAHGTTADVDCKGYFVGNFPENYLGVGVLHSPSSLA